MPEPDLQPARELLAAGKWPEAAAKLEALLRKHPDHPEAHHALALALGQMGMLDRALPLFERAAALSPGDAALHVNRGTALSRAGKTAEAESAFRRAIELAPRLAGAHYNLGQELVRAGRREEAAKALRAAADLFPDAPTFWRDLGRVEASLERWDAAIDAYRKAGGDGDDCHLDAAQELAAALESAGRHDEALAAWQGLVAKAPLLPAPRNHAVSLLARMNRLDEAEAVARAGAAAAPDHPDFQHNLGAVRHLRGDHAGALAAFRRALLLDPTRLETAQATASPLDPQADIEHFNPFSDAEHRIGLLTLRISSPDDLSRALAHALPALLAELARSPAELRHVAPFQKGTTRRADVAFDYLDLDSGRIADLTRATRAERWIAGDLAPDLASVRFRTLTSGSTVLQTEQFPLDLRDPLATLRAAAAFLRLDVPVGGLPAPRSVLHFGLGATASDDALAFDHLTRALSGGPFPAAESEYLRRSLDLLRRGDAQGAIARLQALPHPSGRSEFLRGQAHFASQQFEEARSAWSRAREIDPAMRTPVVPSAWLEVRAGRLDEAAKLFASATSDDEEGPGALVGLGCIDLARRNPRAAREKFLEALARSPRMPEALFEMALAWHAEGNQEEALRWARKLEQTNEGHPLVQALAQALGLR